MNIFFPIKIEKYSDCPDSAASFTALWESKRNSSVASFEQFHLTAI